MIHNATLYTFLWSETRKILSFFSAENVLNSCQTHSLIMSHKYPHVNDRKKNFEMIFSLFLSYKFERKQIEAVKWHPLFVNWQLLFLSWQPQFVNWQLPASICFHAVYKLDINWKFNRMVYTTKTLCCRDMETYMTDLNMAMTPYSISDR